MKITYCPLDSRNRETEMKYNFLANTMQDLRKLNM